MEHYLASTVTTKAIWYPKTSDNLGSEPLDIHEHMELSIPNGA